MENPASDGYSDPAARTGRREVTAKDREILFGREPISALKVVALIASTQGGAEPKPDAWEVGAWLPGRQSAITRPAPSYALAASRIPGRGSIACTVARDGVGALAVGRAEDRPGRAGGKPQHSSAH